MSVVPLVYKSSSYRNPCPDGTGLGYGSFKNSTTIFLICDAAFAWSDSDKLALGLGLGLGLGIPVLLFVACILSCYCSEYYETSRKYGVGLFRRRTPPKINIDTTPLQMISAREWTEKNLSPSALDSFRFGNLTQELKEEIMMKRVTAGRELTEFVKFAEQINQLEIANWIARLNPGEIPAALRQKALMPNKPGEIPSILRDRALETLEAPLAEV
jgi:hypothetical protein